LGLWGPVFAAGETLDRVEASAGNVAITASDVWEEYRLELFLKGTTSAVEPDAATLERVRDRLLDQTILEQEAEAEGVERADLDQQAAQALSEVRRLYASDEAYHTALRERGLTEAQILNRLQSQVLALRLIDQRLRPSAWVERSEIEAYYAETFVPQFNRQNTGPAPSLDDVEAQIREILVQKKIDQLLTGWLAELKVGRRATLHSF
jgi:hypothetical protein